MKKETFKNIYGLYIIIIHFGLLFYAFLIFPADGFSNTAYFNSTLSALLPLLATIVAIVLNYIFSDHRKDESKEKTTKVFVAFFVTTIFLVTIVMIITDARANSSLELKEYSLRLGLMESCFGVFIGFMVKSLYLPKEAVL
jgi:predicted neutral ceramidase superfamily lipid hydrolase